MTSINIYTVTMKEVNDIRQPIVQGLFYPDGYSDLKAKVGELININSSKRYVSDTIIVPHGGWDFVGDYIGKAFNSISNNQYSRVVLISNVHREFTNKIILPRVSKFRICENEMEVDKKAINQIKNIGKNIEVSDIPHTEEHGIECILPFVLVQYPKAKIVPILLGKTIVSLVRALSDIIMELKDGKTLFVVSSNFSEYEGSEISKNIGEFGLNLVSNRKVSDIIELTRTNKLKICGAGGIASILLPYDYSKVEVLKAGLSKGTQLSQGKGTYYSTLILEK